MEQWTARQGKQAVLQLSEGRVAIWLPHTPYRGTMKVFRVQLLPTTLSPSTSGRLVVCVYALVRLS